MKGVQILKTEHTYCYDFDWRGEKGADTNPRGISLGNLTFLV